MRKTIKVDGRRRQFDTETARLVKTRNFGLFGDPAGYQESLYRTRSGQHFVFGIGGPDSPWPPAGDIRPASEEEAEAWRD